MEIVSSIRRNLKNRQLGLYVCGEDADREMVKAKTKNGKQFQTGRLIG